MGTASGISARITVTDGCAAILTADTALTGQVVIITARAMNGEGMGTVDAKAEFLRMLRVGRTVDDILKDINLTEEAMALNPKTIPEILCCLEEARREYRGTI